MPRLLSTAILVVAGAVVGLAEPPSGGLRTEPLDSRQGQRQTQLELTLAGMSEQPKLGLPDFIIDGDDPELTAAAETVVEVLWRDLEFEREFYMIPRSESARIPSARTPESLPLQRWSLLGADFVVMGYAQRVGNEFEIELRSLAVRGASAGRQDFGARFRGCAFDALRSCAHYIADDFHRQTRRLDGVAQTKLAFVSDRDGVRVAGRYLPEPGLSKEVYISDYDGANPHRVTANQSLNVRPIWSPDGQSLVYTSWSSGFEDLYIIHPFSGRSPSRPASGTPDRRNMLATWSPDGSQIAFASTRSGNLDIWIVNADGSNPRNLTPNTPRSLENAPTFSPTGAQIAFTSDRAGTNQVFIMDADGLTPPRRILSGYHSDRPTWSRLNYIAFSLQRQSGGHDIAVYNVADQRVSVLTDGRGSNESPSVAPNGRHIAFVTTRWGGEQIALIDYPVGGDIRRITNAGRNTYPDWSPISQNR